MQPGQPGGIPAFERTFVGAVILAFWIKSHNWFVHKDKVNVSDGCVWPAFKDVVERYRGHKISLHFRDELKATSMSLDHPGDKTFEILLPPSFNFCYRRFAVCKELCHILTDDVAQHTTDPVQQLNTALETVELVQKCPQDFWKNPFFTQPLSSETFCFVLAMEILLPIKDRSPMLNEIMSGGNLYDIAFRLRIPELLLKFYFKSGYDFAFRRAQKAFLK